MKLLAIETASEACSAALYVDGDCSERFEIAPRRHAELILPMCEELLYSANIAVTDLDAIAFGRGPGAFTGVRIATGVVQGMAWAAGLPVIPVSSLAAVALAAAQQHGCDNIAVAMDARMDEVYWGCYTRDGGNLYLQGEEHVIAPANISLPGGEWFAAGSGWQSYADELGSSIAGQIIAKDSELLPRASTIAELAVIDLQQGKALSAEQAIPVYLRDNVAKKKKQP